jgi:threonine/homoserine/homoserine lactone efflux protein
VFLAIRLAGAAYLVWLGVQALWAAVRRQADEAAVARRGSPFRQGLLSNLGNAKMAVFFTSLLPQFGGTSFGALLGLGLLFSCLTLTWLSLYAVVVERAGDTLRRGYVRRALDTLTGSVLVALGVRVAAR